MSRQVFIWPVLIALALLLLPQSATAQGNMVVNGELNSGAVGWTLTGFGFVNVKNGNPSPDIVLGWPGTTASQTIEGLSPGAIYLLSGDYACYGTDFTNISFQVTLDGVSYFQTAVPINHNWNTFSFCYTATASSAILSLTQTYWEYLSVDNYSIDNISMYAVPEPSSLCLIGVCGIVGVMCFRNWRKSMPCA